MAAFNFPNSPSTNDTHTENSVTWKWDGTVWKRQGVAGAQGAQGVQGAANATTINSNTNNYLITGTGTANTIQGEANLTFDGDILRIGDASNDGALSQLIKLGNNSSGAGTGSQINLGVANGNESTSACINGFLDSAGGTSFAIKTAGTYANQGTVAERLRITSAGRVGINTTSPARIIHAYESTNNNLLFLESGDTNVDIVQADTGGSTRIRNSQGSLVFYVNGDANSSNAANSVTGLTIDGDKDVHVYDDLFIPDKIIHEGDTNTAIRFPSADTVTAEVGGTELLRVNSSGVSIKNSTNTSAFCVGNIRGTASAPSFNEANHDGLAVDVYNEGNPYERHISLAARGYGTTIADMSFWTDSGSSVAERLRIDSSGRVLISGQAALTSTSLSHTLQVASASDANAIAIIGRAADDIGEISFYEADKSTKLGEIQYRTTELNIRTRTAGAEINFATVPSGGSLGDRMTIRADGKVWIGTTNGRIINSHEPRLQISGNDYKQSTVSIINNAADATGAYLFFTKQRSGADGGSTAVAASDILGELRFNAADGNDADSLGGRIIVTAEANASSNSTPSYMTFHTASSTDNGSAPERLRITSAGNVSIHSGAYGGGGAAPQLYVVGTGGRQVKIHNTATGTSMLQITNATTGQGEDAGSQIFTQGSTGDLWIQSHFATADLVFATKASGGSTTEKLRITSTGHLHAGNPSVTNSWGIHAIALPGNNESTFACPGTISIAGATAHNTANMAGGGIRFVGKYDSSNYTTFAHVAGVKENTVSGEYGGALTFHTRTNGSLGAERLRITSGGTLYSYSPDDATPNIAIRSNDTNWHGYLTQTVHGGSISSILSCGGKWNVDGSTYSATKDYNGSFPTAALVLHNQYNGSNGGHLVFLTKAAGSSTTDGTVSERLRIASDGELVGTQSTGKMQFNNCQYYQWGGYIACNATVSVSIPVLGNGNIYKITAHFSHYNNDYGTYREGTYGAYSGHAGMQMSNDLTNHSHSYAGQWNITRGSAGQPVVVAKTAGSYHGYGYWFVHVIAGTA